MGLAQVAEILGVSRRTALRYATDGTLPARRMGRRYVVLADDLDTYLQSLPAA